MYAGGGGAGKWQSHQTEKAFAGARGQDGGSREVGGGQISGRAATHSCLFPSLFHQAVKVPRPPTRNLYERFGVICPREYLFPKPLAQLEFWLGPSVPDRGCPAPPCTSLTCSGVAPTQLPAPILGSYFTLQSGLLAWAPRPAIFSQVASWLQRWEKGAHSFSGVSLLEPCELYQGMTTALPQYPPVRAP